MFLKYSKNPVTKPVFRALFLSLFLFLSVTAAIRAEEVNKVIARVNSQVITSKDLDDFCKVLAYKLSDEQRPLSDNDKEFKQNALKRLIEDRLILDQAKKENIKIPRIWVDDKLKQMVASYPSREHFEQSLIERGLTITLLKEKISEQFLMREIIEKYVKSSISVSPQQISSYYTANKDSFVSLPSFVFYIAKSPEKNALDEISRFISKQGIEPAQKQYGNMLIEIESDAAELKEDISKILGELKPGESSVNKSGGGFLLVYLKEIIPSKPQPLEAVKERIYAYLRDKKFNERFGEWLEELKEKAVIQIYGK